MGGGVIMSVSIHLSEFKEHIERDMLPKEVNNFIEFIHEHRESNVFLSSIWDQIKTTGQLSEKQINGVNNSMTYLAKITSRNQQREDSKDIEPSGNYVVFI